MTRRYKPPRSTIDNANLVWNHCGCDDEEVKREKQKILNDPVVELSYKLMADKIRVETK